VTYQSVLTWPGLRTEYSWLPPHGGATYTKPRQIGVSFSPHQSTVYSHAGRSLQSDIGNGAVWVTGEDGITWTRVREHTEALEMYPDGDWMGRAAEVSAPRIALRPALGAQDPVVVGIASIFRRAHATGSPLGEVTAGQLAWRLITHVLDRFSDQRAAPDHHTGLLEWRRLQIVFDFIETNLSEPLSILELATLYGVTPFHFARSFKRSTGLTVQQYVTTRRMSVAKDLLLGTRRPVVEVAYSVGLRNLSHFRRIFKLHYGAQPSAVRA
jgi:AraC family transcriptional regulator